jgi:pimeloyl-ACP methyl ester carboxylesterase/UDP:flavonoid glycosyltransferase YjiC (YdhE family)
MSNPMRARSPDTSGFVEEGGVRIGYEVFGSGEPTILLLPTWTIVHSRFWKMQVPYLAEHFRVITYDGPGNGSSGRPLRPTRYSQEAQVVYALAVLEATGTDQAVLVSLSRASNWALQLMADHPERVLGGAFIGPSLRIAPGHEGRSAAAAAFDQPYNGQGGWWQYNKQFWQEHHPEFLNFFFGQVFNEPHSTKPTEDCVGWGLETTPEVLLAETQSPWPDREQLLSWCERVRSPVLVIHGSEDAITPLQRGATLAEATGGGLVTLEGSGHIPSARDPVKVNLLLREFAQSLAPPKPQPVRWARALQRPKRVLFVSSPIGLGHVHRDLAVVRELRKLRPGLEVDWWAQHPVTRVLEAAGERVHPQSQRMSSESEHWERESSGHELHAFGAFRRMDEIFLHNFMLFHDLTRSEAYDLWIGDESWEVDYYLHENPELKTAPYAFLTDVIGFLPVGSDPREAELCADYNLEMIEQRSRFPGLRDLSLYVGDLEDLPDAAFGPGLPRIRDWARDWFEPVGYVLPFDPAPYRDTAALRQRLGYDGNAPLLFAAVGGTAIGRGLLEKTARAFNLLRHERPEARMVMVTGPRLEPDSLPDVAGLEKRAYVHDLFEHLACADAAVVQGGLSTTMELVATQRPFVYFPLRKHWEQMHHVAFRLDRYRAGTRLDYAQTSPEMLANALWQSLERPVSYKPVDAGGAARAARRIAELI